MADIDRFRSMFPGMEDASDDEVIGQIMRTTGRSYEEVASAVGVGPRGTFSEMGRQLGASFAVDVPSMIGKGLQYIAPKQVYALTPDEVGQPAKPTPIERLGTTVREFGERNQEDWEADQRGRGVIGRSLVAGARGAGAAAPVLAASIVNPALGLGLTAGYFGGSSAQDTYEKVLAETGDEEAASAAARRVGVIQGAGEALATYTGAKLVGLGSKAFRKSATTTGDVATDLMSAGGLKEFGKQYAKNLVVQPATEVAQDLGTEAVERAYGAQATDMGEIAQSSAEGGLGMALLLGPLGGVNAAVRRRRANALKEALTGEDIPTDIRTRAMDMVMEAAKKEGVAEADVDQWFSGQLELEDQRITAAELAEAQLRVRESQMRGTRAQSEVLAAAKAEGKAERATILKAAGKGETLEADQSTSVVSQAEIELAGAKAKRTKQTIALWSEVRENDKLPQEAKDTILSELGKGYKQGKSAYVEALGALVTPEVAAEATASKDPAAAIGTATGLVKAATQQAATAEGEVDLTVKTPETTVPVTDTTAPVTDTTAPVVAPEVAAPVTDTTAPVVAPEVAAPVTDTTAPAVAPEAQRTVFRSQPPVADVADTQQVTPTPAPATQATPAERVVSRPTRRSSRVVTPVAPVQSYVAPEADITAPTEVAAQPQLTEEDQLAVLEATGRDQAADVIRSEQAGKRVDSQIVDEASRTDALDKVITAHLTKSKNKARDAALIREVLDIMANAPAKSKTALQEDLAARNDIDKTRLSQIANLSELNKTARKLGYSGEDVDAIFGVSTVKAVAADKTEGGVVETLATQGVAPDSEGNIGFGLDKSTTWKVGVKKQGIGDVKNVDVELANQKIVDLLDAQDKFRAILETLDDEQARADVEARLKKINKKLEVAIAAAAKVGRKALPKSKKAASKKTEAKAKETKPAQFGAEKQQGSQVYTADELVTELVDFVRGAPNPNKLVIVDTLSDLLLSKDRTRQIVGAMMGLNNAYGVASNGVAYLVADRVRKGTGRAKFMHEVGVHLGLENLLPTDTYNKLVDQITAWSKKDDGSTESELAKRAVQRVKDAGTEGAADQRSELLAYFTEEAVAAGIEPTANLQAGTPLQQWFRTLWAAFKVAVRKLGMNPQTLTAQDVVNLAFGAARLEISGTWHGTAASFRRFSNKFMGTGEGAQAFGWGTYLAQRVGIAKGYWKADIARKEKFDRSSTGSRQGSLMRVDVGVAGNEMLDWDNTLDSQPEILAKLQANLSKELQEYIAYQFDQPVGDFTGLTGEDIYNALKLAEEFGDGLVSKAMGTDKYASKRGDRAASMYLDSLGIKALKFLDARSRPSNSVKRAQRGVQRAEEDVRRAQKDVQVRKDTLDKEIVDLQDRITKMEGLLADPKTSKSMGEYYTRIVEMSRENITEVEKELANIAKGQDVRSRFVKDMQDLLQRAQDRLARAIATADADKPVGGITSNVVVFDDKNIIRAATEIGADRQRMQFGKDSGMKGAPNKGTVAKNVAKMPPFMRGPVSTVANTLGDWKNRALERVMFTHDLVNRAVSEGLNTAKEFERLLAARGNLVRTLEMAGERVADMYAVIPEAERGNGDKSASRFLFDSTRLGKWGYDTAKFTADPEMKARFDALSKESQAFIKAVFTHGDEMLARKKAAVIDHTTSVYDERIKEAEDDGDTNKAGTLRGQKKAALKRFRTLFAVREGLPYAPIKRTGPWAVVAKSAQYLEAEAAKDTKALRELEQSEDHYHVSFVETKNEARVLQEQLREEGFYDNDSVDFFERDKFRDQLFGGSDMLQAVSKLRSLVQAKDEATGKASAALNSMVDDLYLNTLAETSARKSEMRRRGVAGEVDMLRSFAQQAQADAQFVASVEYGSAINTNIQAMAKEASAANRTRRSEVRNELMERYVNALNPSHTPTLNAITRVASVYYLATSPAYYLQNLTQPWMMSLPAMAQRHDYTKAAGLLTKAYGQLAPLMKDTKVFSQSFDFSKIADKEIREVVMELAARGRIDIGMETEMGQFRVDGEGKFSNAWNRVDKGMRLAVQKVESANRISTAVAAYQLELEKNKGDKAKAIDYADSILTETHGDYSRLNANRYFNSNLGKVALQFRKFQLIQLSFYAKLVKNSFSGKDKAAAFKALMFALGHTAVAAGLQGLPGATAAIMLANWIFSDDDEPFDTVEALRTYIGDKDVSDLLLKGAPTLVGMDVSGKIGAGTMLSVMPFSNADLTTTSGIYQFWGEALLGASGGLATRLADGLYLMASGDYYKGIEKVLPKGLSDMLKGYRFATEGMTNRRGVPFMDAEDVSAWEAALTAVGIAPADQTRAYERRSFNYKTKDFYTSRTSEIKSQYIKAVKERDVATMTDLRNQWSSLQRAKRKIGLPVSPLSDLLRAPMEQQKEQRRSVGGVPYDSLAGRKFATELANR